MRWSFVLIPLLFAAGPALAQSQPRPAPPPAESLASPGRAGWTVDARNGCWVWTLAAPPVVTVTWGGACPLGPAEGQGQGEWRYSEDGQLRVKRFSGALSEGRLNGRAMVTWPNGDRYQGEFLDGRISGRGRMTLADARRYEGEFRDNNFSGQGVLTTAHGSRYQGEFRDGRMSGQGVLTGANGVRYEGTFRENRPDGPGAGYSPATGLWYRGQWADGCFLGSDGTRWSILRPLSECP